MLEDMQAAPRQSGDAMPPAPEAIPAAGTFMAGQGADDTEQPLEVHLQRPRSPLAPEAAMWSSSGSPATLPRHTAGSADPVDWDSLLPLLPESVRLLRQVLEDDAALHRLLEHCGGLTLRIPRRFPAEGHLLRALLPEPVLRRLLGAYGGTCLYIPRCARLARQVRQRELLGAFSRHTAAGTSSNAEVRFLARRYGITDRRVWQLLKQEAELPDKALQAPGDALQG